MRRHVILVGLSGAGKSTVGARAAELLAAPFIDLDAVIERQAGARITDIFAGRGEVAFRALEREAMRAATSGAASVIAAGAGWAAQPGNLEHVASAALVVHLQCTVAAAASRLADDTTRPLLAGDLRQRLEVLARERAPAYARAEASVETVGRGVDAVAADVAALARSSGGW